MLAESACNRSHRRKSDWVEPSWTAAAWTQEELLASGACEKDVTSKDIQEKTPDRDQSACN